MTEFVVKAEIHIGDHVTERAAYVAADSARGAMAKGAAQLILLYGDHDAEVRIAGHGVSLREPVEAA